jgi:hypothetical protein
MMRQFEQVGSQRLGPIEQPADRRRFDVTGQEERGPRGVEAFARCFLRADPDPDHLGHVVVPLERMVGLWPEPRHRQVAHDAVVAALHLADRHAAPLRRFQDPRRQSITPARGGLLEMARDEESPDGVALQDLDGRRFMVEVWMGEDERVELVDSSVHEGRHDGGAGQIPIGVRSCVEEDRVGSRSKEIARTVADIEHGEFEARRRARDGGAEERSKPGEAQDETPTSSSASRRGEAPGAREGDGERRPHESGARGVDRGPWHDACGECQLHQEVGTDHAGPGDDGSDGWSDEGRERRGVSKDEKDGAERYRHDGEDRG